MAHDVFISYTTRDKAIADAVCHALEARGIRCWIAPRDVTIGLSWKAVIVGAIRTSKVMVLIFSGEVNQSPDVRREVDIAFEETRPIIPFRIENVEPSDELYYCIADRHWLDAVTPPIEQHIDRLVQALDQFRERPPEPITPAAPPISTPEAPEIPEAPETPEPLNREQDAEPPVPGPAGVPAGSGWQRRAAIAAAGVVALASLGMWVSRPDYDEIARRGVEAYRAKRYDEAVPLLKQAADRGVPSAQSTLARALLNGYGIPQDESAARSLAEAASAKNDPGGDAVLGYFYQEGRGGLQQDRARALELFRRAAASNEPFAQMRLGYSYEEGVGVTKSLTEAIRWYERAAEGGHGYARCRLATHAVDGTGGQKDYDRGVRFYRAAAEQGETCGELGYGYMFWNGYGVGKSYDEAMRWWEIAAAKGETAAKENIERMQDRWVMEPLFVGAWQRVAGPDRRAEIDRVRPVLFTGKLQGAAPQRLRRLNLPFYEGAVIYELEVSRADGVVGILTYIRRGDAVVHVNGKSDQIHELSRSAPIRIETLQQAVAFLRFFMGAVQGEEGTFRLVDEPSQLHWKNDTPRNVAHAIKALDVRASSGGGWVAKGTVRYSNALFSADLRLKPDGSVDMTDDVPTAVDLPLSIERFDDSGLRVRVSR